MWRNSVAVVVLVVLAGCQSLSSGSRYNEPFFYETVDAKTSKVVLHQALPVLAQQARTYIQGGVPVSNKEVNKQEANCEFEVRRLSPVATEIQPDTFKVTRVVRTEELFSRHDQPLLVASQGGGGVADLFKFATRLTLQSERQPNVVHFTCSHMEHLTNGGDHLRYSQFQQAAGKIVSVTE